MTYTIKLWIITAISLAYPLYTTAKGLVLGQIGIEAMPELFGQYGPLGILMAIVIMQHKDRKDTVKMYEESLKKQSENNRAEIRREREEFAKREEYLMKLETSRAMAFTEAMTDALSHYQNQNKEFVDILFSTPSKQGQKTNHSHGS